MIDVKVNGSQRQFDGDPDMPLLWYLRDLLQYTGTKFGCGMGLCGSCTVHLNGAATRSCVTSMKDVAGKEVTTIEGLSANEAVNLVYRLERGARPVTVKKALIRQRFDDPAKLDLSLTIALIKPAPAGQR